MKSGPISRETASARSTGSQQVPASAFKQPIRIRISARWVSKRAALSILAHFRSALWNTFRHDSIALAKAGAYSSALTLFPALMVVASVLASFTRNKTAMTAVTNAMGSILPAAVAQSAQTYFISVQKSPFRTLTVASLITLWTASGVLVSWMDGFRRAYQMPKTWGLVKERLIALGLVIMAGLPLLFATALVAFGNRIELRLAILLGQQLQPLVLFSWAVLRWVIAILTTVSVMQVIYHHAVPRTLPWHTATPGAVLATAIWFPVTMFFAWYVSRYAEYSIFYGPLATAVVLLIWMYILSLIVLVGAEFNALLYPRGRGNVVVPTTTAPPFWQADKTPSET